MTQTPPEKGTTISGGAFSSATLVVPTMPRVILRLALRVLAILVIIAGGLGWIWTMAVLIPGGGGLP